MLAASAVMLMLNTAGPTSQATPIGLFMAAVRGKDPAKRGELVVRGIDTFDTHDDDRPDELDRVFPLYLGLLAADLPAPNRSLFG